MKPRFSNEEAKILARGIAELEARTSAELVLVIRGASGNYRRVDLLGGSLAALLPLAWMLLSPQAFHYVSVPLPIALVFLLGWRIMPRGRLRNLLTTRDQRHRRVLESASAVFESRGIRKTSHRQGILVYCSLFERDAVILPDENAKTALGDPELLRFQNAFAQAASSTQPARHFASTLRSFGVHLGRKMPAREETRAQELADEIDFEDSSK